MDVIIACLGERAFDMLCARANEVGRPDKMVKEGIKGGIDERDFIQARDDTTNSKWF